MRYDIIVLGAGSAGLNVAVFMNSLKLKVLMVEKHLIGGDCLNTGCVPSKALISLAHQVHAARGAGALGVHTVGGVDMEKVAAKIKERQDVIRVHEHPEYFREKGIDVEIGSPRFVSPTTIEINNKTCTAKRIVCATGSRPAVPPIEGLEHVDYLTNETIFSNKTLPRHLLVIGAGPIGIEMAQAYRRLGAEVTVLDLQEYILPREDEDIAERMTEVLSKEGINFRLGVRPVRFPNKKSLIIRTSNEGPSGREETLTFDRVLVAAGRRLNIENLDLEKGEIEVRNHRIVVDAYLRTSNKRVYCCGDVVGDYQFTHWAEYQAAVAIRNMMSPFKTKVDRRRVAWVTYTDPEVATFGLRPVEMTARGMKFRTFEVPMKDVDRAICEGIEAGVLKVHVAKGKIVGGTLMGAHAGEMVGELLSFMTLGIPFSKLYNRIYPYPTLARIHRKSVQQYLGEKLTPRTAGILRRIYKLRSLF